MTALDELLARARAPLGSRVEVYLGGGVRAELAALLSTTNGFAVFNYGVQVFHFGPDGLGDGLGPELGTWNDEATWKYAYGGLADGLLCFGQDLFGVQFAIEDGQRVSTFDPETGERQTIGERLEDWADWLLAKPDERGVHSFATSWQHEHGALDHGERLLPKRPFIFGVEYTADNLVVSDAVTAMRVRGPIARQVYDLPDGAAVTLATD
jgi:hypothetical protein